VVRRSDERRRAKEWRKRERRRRNSFFTFFTATRSPVSSSVAEATTPYAPLPMACRIGSLEGARRRVGGGE